VPDDVTASMLAEPARAAAAALPSPLGDGGRRLLVLSYYFPPGEAVGGMRWAGHTRQLAALGWQIAVLTAPPDVAGPAPEGVTLETCPPGLTATQHLLRVRGLVRAIAGVQPRQPAPGGREEPGLHAHSPLRREAAALLALANEGRGWVLRAARRTRALIRRFRPHVVVSTSPPHGTHLAAWLATRGRRVRWFVDFRDPWAGPIAKAWQSSALRQGRLATALIAREERLWVNAATGVLTNTVEFADALALRYPGVAVTCVPNAVDRDRLPQRRAARFPGLAIAHVGTLYGSRTLAPVLRGLRMFLDRHSALDGGTRLRTAGVMNDDKAKELERDVSTLGLGGHVEVLGAVPRHEALTLLARSHLAIVLAQDQDYQVPAKLYESVGMGIPTLVVAAPPSAAGREARRLGAVLVEPGDVTGVARALEQVWAHPARYCPRPEGPVEYRDLAPDLSALLAGECP